MKARALILILIVIGSISIAASVNAVDTVTVFRPGPQPSDPSVTMDLNDIPLPDAIKTLFTASSVKYAYGPDIDVEALKKVHVSIHVKDVPLWRALTTLLMQTDLVWDKSTDRYLIYKRSEGRMPVMGPGVVRTPSQQIRRTDTITIKIPATSVKQAVAMVDPGWKFDGNLGDQQIPGVRLFQFSRDMAAALILISSGLIPQDDKPKTVAMKGSSDLVEHLRWLRLKHAGSYRDPNINTDAVRTEPALSIGAYKFKASKEWLYVVMAYQVRDVDLIESIFSMSGRSYVIGDLSARQSIRSKSDWKLSAELYNVTLDRALDSLLPAVGLTYRKNGPPDNPVYYIDVLQPDTAKKPINYRPGPAVSK